MSVPNPHNVLLFLLQIDIDIEPTDKVCQVIYFVGALCSMVQGIKSINNLCSHHTI